jgi:hypothetical protein
LAGLALLTAAAASPAFAHSGGSNGYASISIGPSSVRYSLTLWPATLPAAVSEQIKLARAGDGPSRDWLVGVIRDKVTLVSEGRRCEPGSGSLAHPASPAESVTFVVDFACGGDVRDLLVRDDLFDILGVDYHTLARIDTPGGTTHFAFTPETRETRVNTGRRGTASFVLLGIEHILTGWDHLLFLLVLLLAVLDIVTLPGRFVEAVIALSIAVVAAENLFPRPVLARRWLVSFVFGLVHGFGFSSVLREIGLPTDGLLLALFGFNAGVELGQALVVVVVLPALALVRDTRWEPRVVWGSSLAILLVGVVLFVQRVLL